MYASYSWIISHVKAECKASYSKSVASKSRAFETVDWEFGAERDRLLREALQKSNHMRQRSRSKWRRIASEFLNAGQVNRANKRSTFAFVTRCHDNHLCAIYHAFITPKLLLSELVVVQGWFVFLVVGFDTGLLAGMIQVSFRWLPRKNLK